MADMTWLKPSAPPWQQGAEAPAPVPAADAPARKPRARPRAPEAPAWGAPTAPAAPIRPAAPPARPVMPRPVAAASDAAPVDAVERIRAVAAKGGTLKGLHALFGVSADVMKRWMDENPGMRKAFDEGKEQEREALHRTLYDAATLKRDLNAAQFLLKTRHGYREQEPEDTRNSVRIVFNLPAAAPDLKTYVEQNEQRGPSLLPRAPLVIDHE